MPVVGVVLLMATGRGLAGLKRKRSYHLQAEFFCIPTIPPESDTTAEFFFAGSLISETVEQNRQSEFLSWKLLH
jgi:hypothetical protein